MSTCDFLPSSLAYFGALAGGSRAWLAMCCFLAESWGVSFGTLAPPFFFLCLGEPVSSSLEFSAGISFTFFFFLL